jgi:hypothetical protein
MTVDWDKMIYNSGDFFFPRPLKEFLDKDFLTTHKRSFYINGWSFMHFFSGIVTGAIYLYLGRPIEFYYFKLLVIHTIWELWQMLIGMSKPWKLTGDSNLIDTFVDTIIFMMGTYITFILYNQIINT